MPSELHQWFLNKGKGWDTGSCSSPILPALTAWKTTTQPSCGERASPPSLPTEVHVLNGTHHPMLQPPAKIQTPQNFGSTSIRTTLRICNTSDCKILCSQQGSWFLEHEAEKVQCLQTDMLCTKFLYGECFIGTLHNFQQLNRL